MSQLHLAGSDRHCFTRQLAPENPHCRTVSVHPGSRGLTGLADSLLSIVGFVGLRMVNRMSSWSNVAGALP